MVKAQMQMKGTGSQKSAGSSWIELDEAFCEFTLGRRNHSDSDQIPEMVDRLSSHFKDVGCVPTGHVISSKQAPAPVKPWHLQSRRCCDMVQNRKIERSGKAFQHLLFCHQVCSLKNCYYVNMKAGDGRHRKNTANCHCSIRLVK